MNSQQEILDYLSLHRHDHVCQTISAQLYILGKTDCENVNEQLMLRVIVALLSLNSEATAHIDKVVWSILYYPVTSTILGAG